MPILHKRDDHDGKPMRMYGHNVSPDEQIQHPDVDSLGRHTGRTPK